MPPARRLLAALALLLPLGAALLVYRQAFGTQAGKGALVTAFRTGDHAAVSAALLPPSRLIERPGGALTLVDATGTPHEVPAANLPLLISGSEGARLTLTGLGPATSGVLDRPPTVVVLEDRDEGWVVLSVE